jgi:hypothetical protein
LPRFQATHDDIQLLMSWPSKLCSKNFLLSKTIWCPSCMRTPLIVKSFTLMWTLNDLVKSRNFHAWVDKKFLFQGLKMPYVAFISIQKTTPSWGDLKATLLSTKTLLWTFDRSCPCLGRIVFLWMWLVFSSILWLTTS